MDQTEGVVQGSLDGVVLASVEFPTGGEFVVGVQEPDSVRIHFLVDGRMELCRSFPPDDGVPQRSRSLAKLFEGRQWSCGDDIGAGDVQPDTQVATRQIRGHVRKVGMDFPRQLTASRFLGI